MKTSDSIPCLHPQASFPFVHSPSFNHHLYRLSTIPLGKSYGIQQDSTPTLRPCKLPLADPDHPFTSVPAYSGHRHQHTQSYTYTNPAGIPAPKSASRPLSPHPSTTMNPIIVIVPGSWHPAAAYTAFATALNNAGFPTHIASYPSLDPSDPTTATCQADATAIRSQLLQLLDDKNDESRDIIVLPHSYGGNPSAGAAHGLSKAAREREGKRGGVLGLVYMTAFCVPGGACTLDLLGGKHAPFVNVDHVRRPALLCL